MRRLACLTLALSITACSGDEPPPPDDTGGGSLDQFINSPDMPPPRRWTSVRVDDDTPAGLGLTLDAAEVCNLAGMACVPMVVQSSSDDTLDYTGAEDGPNSQDESCTEETFTRLGGPGNFVVFALPDDGEIIRGSKINIWTVPSACTFVFPGDQPFTVTVADEQGEGPVESCAGTCTVVAP